MMSSGRFRFALFFAAVVLAALPAPAAARRDATTGWGLEENRTVNRSPVGHIFIPEHLFRRPEHYRFLPEHSNHHPQHQHIAQWEAHKGAQGEYAAWDPAAWTGRWTPENVIRNLYANGTFYRQYMGGRRKTIPVLEVGPTFYKIANLDQIRSLKLLADDNAVFENGHTMVELRDWVTREVIGSYTPQGLFLN